MKKRKEKGFLLSPKHGLNPMMGLCPLCGGLTDQIFLLGRINKADDEAPGHGLHKDSLPCGECKERMKQGVLLIEVMDGTQGDPYRTGRLYVLHPDDAKRVFDNIGDHRSAFIEESAARKAGLPTDDIDINQCKETET